MIRKIPYLVTQRIFCLNSDNYNESRVNKKYRQDRKNNLNYLKYWVIIEFKKCSFLLYF